MEPAAHAAGTPVSWDGRDADGGPGDALLHADRGTGAAAAEPGAVAGRADRGGPRPDRTGRAAVERLHHGARGAGARAGTRRRARAGGGTVAGTAPRRADPDQG